MPAPLVVNVIYALGCGLTSWRYLRLEPYGFAAIAVSLLSLALLELRYLAQGRAVHAWSPRKKPVARVTGDRLKE